MSPPGYSGTPLWKKLGIKPGSTVHLLGAPREYRNILTALPEGVEFVSRLSRTTDLIQVFSARKAHLENTLAAVRQQMRADAVVWVSWPKKAARVPTDITEDVVRQVALPLGLVDIKVCAVDEVWSGLKLMVRRELR